MSLVPAGHGQIWVPELMIGDIEVSRHWIRTPMGVLPSRDAVWAVEDGSDLTRVIPAWAWVACLLTIMFCLIGLLFLFVREDRRRYYAQVTLTGPGFTHSTRLYGTGADISLHARQLVGRARWLAWQQ